MKVATVTFHWATNYGALLQAHALQRFLETCGWETEIVDYRPGWTVLLRALERVRHGRFSEFALEARLRRFRRDYLTVSRRTYRSNRSLRSAAFDHDVFISGSDQVLNESFVRHAEVRPTLSYYLDFVPDDRVRVAYAVSFGTDCLSADISKLVLPELRRFTAIGVRENTGKTIVEALGLPATLVVDPTLLLTASHYEKMFADQVQERRSGVFPFILHHAQGTPESVIRHVRQRYSEVCREGSRQAAVPEWLAAIRNAELVVTNSFHAVVFALLFHTPFISIAVEGSGMNDRLATLLGAVGLQSRLVTAFNPQEISRLCEEVIDWVSVDEIVNRLSSESARFVHDAVMGACT